MALPRRLRTRNPVRNRCSRGRMCGHSSNMRRRRKKTRASPQVRRRGCSVPGRNHRSRLRLRRGAYQEHYEEQEPEYSRAPVHPLHRYAAQHVAPEPEYREDLPFRMPGRSPDPSALLRRCAVRADRIRRAGFPDAIRPIPEDPYAYQSSYEEEEPAPRSGGPDGGCRRAGAGGGGDGGYVAYRTYVGSPRSGEPPIIKADNSPTKIVPAPADGVAKTPDRMVPGDGAEKLVSREETPVDGTEKIGGPRVVFPPLNPNSNPPSVASITHNTAAAHGRERHYAQQRTAQDQDTFGQGRRGRRRHPASAPPPPQSSPQRRPPSLAHRVMPMPAPTRRWL